MANSIALQVENAQVALAPGENAVVRLNMTNSGDVVDAFTVQVMGIEPSWFTLSASEVKLFPRQQATVTLQINPPQGSTRPLAGFYPFTVLVLSRDNPTTQATGQGMISLSAVGGLALDMQPRSIAGRQGLYAVTLSNGSNSPRTTVLALSDPEEALQFNLGTPSVREGEVTQADVFAAPTTTGYTNGSYVTPPAFGASTAKGQGVLEHEIELPASSTVVVPVMVKPIKAVWTGKERPFPFTVGAHPPGVEWEASEAQTSEGQLAYRPIFAAWAGMPMAMRRALMIAIPLLVLALLLFLLLRPKETASLNAAAQTATAQALSVSQTQTALAIGMAQTMTAVAQANGGNSGAANATLTALAQGNSAQQTALASAAQTAQAGANLTATAVAQGAGATEGAAIIDRFYLKLADPNATATPVGGGIAGSDTSLRYNVSGASDVRILQSSRPFQATGLVNASVIDFRMVATGTNQVAVTRTLSVLVVRPPTITSFDGLPLTIGPGESTSLLWQVLGAQGVTIDDIPVTTTGVDGNGQISVQPNGTRRFIMCATNPVGTVCRSVIVTVLRPGDPTPTPIPPTRVPTTAVPTRAPNTAVPTTAVPIVTATACTEDYTVEREEEATVVPGLTPVAGLQCDDCSSTVMLPFPFQLYDRVFDRVSVGSNGTLNFATANNPVSTNACLPVATGFDYAVFPHWDNLTTVGANRGVFTRVDGDAPERIFTIEWRAAYVTGNAPTGTANFEVRLFENSPDQRFEVIYGTLTQGGNSATVGVQRATGSNRTQYACNTSNTISQGIKLIFRLPCGGSGTGERPLSCVPGDITINIKNGKFSPRNIIITQGSVISWVNLDSEVRNVVGPNNLWSSGPIAQNAGFKTIINTPGVYYYSSTLDENLTGNITVLVACTATPTPPSTSTRTSTAVRTTTAVRTGTPSSTVTRTGTQPTSTSTVTGTPPTGTTTGTSTVTATPSPGTATSTPTFGSGGQECILVQSITGSIKEGDPVQNGRVGLYNRPSTCALGDSCLPQPDSIPRRYDSYTFSNDEDVAQCITVQIGAEGCTGAGVMSVAYLGGFDPNNLCLNFLAQGGPPTSTYTYSFMVPANSTYVVVVHEYAPDGGCGEYTVRVGVCQSFTPTPVTRPTDPPPPGITNTPPVITSTRTNTRPPSATRTNTPVTPSATRTSTLTRTATLTATVTATATCVTGQDYIYTVGTGNVISATNRVLSDCDNCTASIALPFPVTFYGTNYISATVGSNGTLGFIANSNPISTTCLPNPAFNAALLPAWNDYVLVGAGSGTPTPGPISDGVYTEVTGTAPNRVFNIEWRVSTLFCGGVCVYVPSNFEVRLYETPPAAQPQRVDFVYGQMFNGGNGSVIGVQRDTGSRFTQVTCDARNTAAGTVVTLYVPACAVTVTPTPTRPLVTATSTVTVTPTQCISTNYSVTLIPPVPSATPVIVPGTSFIPGSDQNNVVVTTTLPISIQFYGQTYSAGSTIYLSDNGNLRFTPTAADGDNSCLPVTSHLNTIFAFWDNLLASSGGGIFTTVTGTAPNRVFYIEWRGFVSFNDSPVNFEIALYEGQDGFDLLYGDMSNSINTGTIGVQGNTSTFTQYSCNAQTNVNDSILQFRRGACTTVTPSVTGTSTTTATGTATITATPVGACPWSAVAPYPVIMADSAVAGQGGLLYSFGGRASDVAIFNAYSYNPATNTWTALANVPAPLRYSSAVSDGTFIYLVNGFSTSVSYLARYSPASNSYTTLANPPLATTFHSTVYLNGVIYRIGGTELSGATATVDRYDIATNTWSAAAPMPQAVTSPMASSFGGFVYVAGGINGPTESLKTYRYDPVSNTWNDAAVIDLPATRYWAASSVLNGKWILAGGFSGGAVTNTAINYDPSTNTWSSLPNLALARASRSADVVGSNMYVVAGFNPSLVETTDVQSFRFAPCGTATPTATATAPPAACNWTAAGAYPTAVIFNAVAAQGGQLYSFGNVGTDITTPVSVSSYTYNPVSNAWAPIADLPSPRSAAAAVSDGTYIYISNGRGSGGGRQNSLFRYDPALNTYSTLANSPLATSFNGAAYLNGVLYRIAGSISTGETATVDMYNISTNTWSAAAPLPQAVSSPFVTTIGGFIYVAGGKSGGTESIKAYRYDPTTNTWDDASVADLPAPRSDGASGLLDGNWVLAGGTSASVNVNTAIAYNAKANTWSSLPNMPAVRAFMGGAVAGNYMYVVGGSPASSGGTPDVQRFGAAPCPLALPATPTSTASTTPTQVVTPAVSSTAVPRAATRTITPTSTLTPGPSESCQQWITDGDPYEFSSDGIIESDLDVPLNGLIDSLSVSNLSITREGAGKVSGYLVSPGGIEVELFNWVCRNPGDTDAFRWLNISLSDDAGKNVSGVYCQDTVKGGTFAPDSAISSGSVFGKYQGSPAPGTWKLVLKADVREVDSLRLDSWGLNICATGSTMPSNRAVSSVEGAQGNVFDLMFAVVAAALASIGAPLAWARTRGVMFVDDRR